MGNELNASKTKTMIVSRSCIVHPPSTLLTLDGTIPESADLVKLGVTFDVRSTFAMLLELQLEDLVSRESPCKYFMIFFEPFPAGFGVFLSIVVLSC